MSYQDIIQSVGKQLTRNVYYYDNNNNMVTLSEDDIEQIIIRQNCDIVGTLMKCVELNLKTKIDTKKEIYVEITATLDNETATKTYGPYYLYSCEYSADDKIYEHVCYDKFLQTMVEYQEVNLSYPTTVQTFYNKVINTLGLTSNVSLINGNVIMSNDIYYNTGYTYRSVIQDIAEANGILLYIDGTQVKEATLGDNNNVAVVDDDILKNTNIDFGEKFGPINLIALTRGAGSDTIYYPEVIPSTPKEFKISDNIMLGNNNRDQFIQGIYNKLVGISYDIFETELVGYGGFEPLQKVRFETGDNVYNSYVFNNEIIINAGYNETIYTEAPLENENSNYNASDTTDNRIKQTYLLVNKQTQEIKSVVESELYNEQGESKINQITQDIDSLRAEIGRTADITTLSEGTGVIYLEDILESEIIYLQIHPTQTDINYNVVNKCKVSQNTKVQSPTIYFQHLSGGEVDNTYSYTLPKQLYYYSGSVYDEFILDNETQTSYIIHRVGINSDGTKYKLNNEVIEYVTFEPYEFSEGGDYNLSFTGFPTTYIKARAMVSNIYTSQYATRVELKSSIKASADEITEQVSQKVGNNEIIAKINLAVRNDQGIIDISGNKVTIDSDNFKLDADGTIEATNGKFSGELNTNQGNLGGWVINSTGLTNGAVKINSDGSSTIYTVADLFIMRAYLMGIEGFDRMPSQMANHYDINGDGEVNSLDYTLLQNLIGISMNN